MGKTQQSLHIPHNLSPRRLRVILSGLYEGLGYTSIATRCGVSANLLRKVLIPTIRQMGFLETSGHQLSEHGKQFLRLADRFPDRFPEATHLWLYTAHWHNQAKGISWAYAQVVDALWLGQDQVLNGLALSQLASIVVERASQDLSLPVERIAFSDRSVRGTLNWLQDLLPPVLILQNGKRVFKRRFFCPDLTFLWAVDFLYHTLSIPFGVRITLSSEHLEQLCRLCVLDPSGIDNVLSMAKRLSDYSRGGLFEFGTEGGLGRWILLAHPLPVPQLPEEVTE